ncbi:hypothetical protein C8A00DRAFT_34668 [Chaetomidium leptoderma]|uniref:Uncharacterized protein n=1 Tax=Chaetomidium leptoderma TaxID=669021 RepID=A0AAN6VJD3_9PEZI|nr:hypothetical protein C8A00DRAFT_34668 [Chaetomidium leptoderma]
MITNNPDTAVTERDAAKDSSAPLPSFEERNSSADQVKLNPETRRIRWTLNGPLETAITVSSLRLCVDPLDDWDYHWMEKHDQHTDLDEKHESVISDDDVFYGPLPGADEGEKLDGGDEHLLVCCGQKRPLGKEAEEVVVKPTTGGGGFVTIHDFISTVHPYLMARRDEVLEAMCEDPGRTRAPFPPETRLVVVWYSAPYVDVLDEAYWMRTRKR